MDLEKGITLGVPNVGEIDVHHIYINTSLAVWSFLLRFYLPLPFGGVVCERKYAWCMHSQILKPPTFSAASILFYYFSRGPGLNSTLLVYSIHYTTYFCKRLHIEYIYIDLFSYMYFIFYMKSHSLETIKIRKYDDEINDAYI